MLRRAKRRLAIKRSYDKGARDLKRLASGQPLATKTQKERSAIGEEVQYVLSTCDRSYIIGGKEGVYRRNRVHLRHTTFSAPSERTPTTTVENNICTARQ